MISKPPAPPSPAPARQRQIRTMRLATSLACLLLATAPTVATAETEITERDYLARMCTLSGKWKGVFRQYNKTGLYRTVPFDAGYQCQPGNQVYVETNTFFWEDGTIHPTLKVIFPLGDDAGMHMSYFLNGAEGIYYFKPAILNITDETHWTAARTATEKTHETAPNPPVSRYTHIRNGNELRMVRDIKPDHASKTWTMSSELILTRQP